MASDGRTRTPRTSVWLSDGRPTPRRKAEPAADAPALDRDKIVAATVRLLDAEGLAKFSMRRLAAELGVTAMSVYWYVDTKDDLLELAMDAACADMRLPGADSGADWRDRLRQLAAEYRRLLVEHPWVSRLMGEYLNIGPHSMAFSTAALQVLNASGLPLEQSQGGLALVYQFVYGFGTIEGRFAAMCQEVGLSQDEYFRHVMGTVEGRPEFAESEALMEQRKGQTVEQMRQHDFETALDCAIAGIEVIRDRARGAARSGQR